jgi:hypothetical protein
MLHIGMHIGLLLVQYSGTYYCCCGRLLLLLLLLWKVIAATIAAKVGYQTNQHATLKRLHAAWRLIPNAQCTSLQSTHEEANPQRG